MELRWTGKSTEARPRKLRNLSWFRRHQGPLPLPDDTGQACSGISELAALWTSSVTGAGGPRSWSEDSWQDS